MNNKKAFPHEMTFKELIIYIISAIGICAFFCIVREDLAGKMILFLVCPMIILYLIYAYRKEKKADKNALSQRNDFISGDYFESMEWREKYISYINEHPFERLIVTDMKKDLLKRFRRRGELMLSLFFLFLMCCTVCAFFYGNYAIVIAGMILFGVLFYMSFSEYIGMPVRKWLKGDIDYDELNRSYINSVMLTYKKSGFAFGTTHIHAFTDKKIYNIDYRLAEGITRKIVRMKKYEDGIYSSEEYKHYAVVHVRLPKSGQIHLVEIELNEFEVQMVIDNFMKYKLGESLVSGIHLTEAKSNENVI